MPQLPTSVYNPGPWHDNFSPPWKAAHPQAMDANQSPHPNDDQRQQRIRWVETMMTAVTAQSRIRCWGSDLGGSSGRYLATKECISWFHLSHILCSILWKTWTWSVEWRRMWEDHSLGFTDKTTNGAVKGSTTGGGPVAGRVAMRTAAVPTIAAATVLTGSDAVGLLCVVLFPTIFFNRCWILWQRAMAISWRLASENRVNPSAETMNP